MKTKHVILIVIAFALFACSRDDNTADAYGNFEAIDVIVSSQANGQIRWLNLDEGDAIDSGTHVGLVDTTNLHLQKLQLISKKSAVASKITSINSQISVQQQQKKNLLTDQQRITNLYAEGAATQKQLDDINGAVDLIDKQISATHTQLQAVFDEIRATEAQIELTDEAIRKSFIINPVSGTVLTKMAEEGEVTAFGKPLYKIANLGDLILKVYISGDQLPQLMIGQEVDVQIDKNSKENSRLKGIVSWISNQAEFTPKIIQTKEERVNLVYAVKVRVKNDGFLKIGMPGEINFMQSKSN